MTGATGVIYGLFEGEELRYIGQTVRSLAVRLMNHVSAAGRRSTYHTYVCRWLRGMADEDRTPIIRSLVEGASIEELNRLEIEWISAARSSGVRLVNTHRGGRGRTAEENAKIGRTQAGRARPYMQGRTHAPERVAKMSAAQKGVPRPYARGARSAEFCAKMSAIRTGTSMPNHRGQKHHQWDDAIDTQRDIVEPIRAGRSAAEIAAALGKAHTFVHRRLGAIGLSVGKLRQELRAPAPAQ